mmetsp:Transcript_12516/g.24938  ORF Transcript_12516/g.24938 Transcript_12516/m.24938 type:complete len:439 (-) Transcript_12516:741-2057(-)
MRLHVVVPVHRIQPHQTALAALHHAQPHHEPPEDEGAVERPQPVLHGPAGAPVRHGLHQERRAETQQRPGVHHPQHDEGDAHVLIAARDGAASLPFGALQVHGVRLHARGDLVGPRHHPRGVAGAARVQQDAQPHQHVDEGVAQVGEREGGGEDAPRQAPEDGGGHGPQEPQVDEGLAPCGQPEEGPPRHQVGVGHVDAGDARHQEDADGHEDLPSEEEAAEVGAPERQFDVEAGDAVVAQLALGELGGAEEGDLESLQEAHEPDEAEEGDDGHVGGQVVGAPDVRPAVEEGLDDDRQGGGQDEDREDGAGPEEEALAEAFFDLVGHDGPPCELAEDHLHDVDAVHDPAALQAQTDPCAEHHGPAVDEIQHALLAVDLRHQLADRHGQQDRGDAPRQERLRDARGQPPQRHVGGGRAEKMDAEDRREDEELVAHDEPF